MTETDADAPTLYIVDGSAYIYRAFYAVRRLSNSAGFPTNALYGFVNMFKKLIEQEDPDYLAMTFDRYDEEDEGKSFRHEMYEDYKANRSAMPDDLRVQVPYFLRFVEAMNVPVMIQSGVEADDVIATATRRARQEGLGVCIISADKDLMQLLDDEGVRMVDTMRDRTFERDDVIDRFGVPPEQVKYVMALAGDSSDNVPGVPGIGEKTGGKLIAEWGDLETLLDNIEEVSGPKRRENLTEYADQARLSLELVTLKEDCEIEFDVDALQISPPDLPALSELLLELEFHSTLKSLRVWFERRGWLTEAQSSEEADGQQLLFAAQAPGEEPQSVEGTAFARPDKDYRTILDEAELDEVLAALEAAELWAFDLETTSIEALDAQIVGMSFAWEPDAAVYVPVAHDYEGAPEQLSLELVLDKVGPLLEDPEPRKVGQHVKYERMVLERYDITFQGVRYDTMLMSYLLDPGKPSHSLDALAMDWLNHQTIRYEDVAGKGKKQIPFAQVRLEPATEYAAEDADVTLMVCRAIEPLIEEEEELLRLHDEIELPLSDVLARMEAQGMCIDPSLMETLSEEFEAELEELQRQINEAAEQPEEQGDLNPNSPKQLREVLFDKLGLPVKRRTKSGPSTAQAVLEQLAPLHPLPELILEYRSFAKLKGTYVDALPELVREDTGRIHTDFNQAVTATGRLSSSNPNLQNIPIRTDRGRQIRQAFVPQDGWVLMGADYSQIELRLLAHLSQDPLMLEAYQQGRDIHALTASQIFEVDLEEVTREQRGVGKTVNFAVIYGVGAKHLAQRLKVTVTEASDYIDSYFERYASIGEYFDELLEQARITGMARTMMGRRRLIPDIDGKGRRAAFAERVAKNMPIQGTAADIIKEAMIEIQQALDERELAAHMLLQVHDELVFEVDPEALEEVRELVVERMEGVVELDVPLEVDVGVGPNWLEAK